MSPTLTDYLAQSGAPPALALLVQELVSACGAISHEVRRGALAGVLGEAGSDNVQGEHQKKLDVIANDMLLAAAERGGLCNRFRGNGAARAKSKRHLGLPGAV